ncbi:MAG: DUF1501 domain-containing protein [Pirellulaceae bacterium]|nr:DUF1501 domain-containing protein [Pirellulaceae bacterium]
MNSIMRHGEAVSRRVLLQRLGIGFGSLALADLVSDRGGCLRADEVAVDLSPRPTHFAPRAKAVIQLFQNGGPSQMDLFDPKPELTKRNGQPHPNEVETFQLNNKNVLLKTPFKFTRHGRSGMPFGETLPHMAKLADDWCMVRSMHTGNNNHPFAINMMQTGKTFAGRPAKGSWICYALGSENDSLPGYIVLRDPAGYNTSGKMVWSSGWLPAVFQGTEFSTSGTAVHHLKPPAGVSPTGRARGLKLLEQLNRRHLGRHPRESELDARIQNFELAARMQLAATDVLDVSRESAETRTLYGLDKPATAGYGLRCLMARRLVEHGVRFVQIFPPLKPSFQPWDSHSNLESGIRTVSASVDQPSAALVSDLKRRGLLDETVVMWTGEFGRLPITENANGRDHNRHAFTMLLTGGGFRGGCIHGATDEFGYQAVENRVSVPDIHATLLHQLGIDHRRLGFRHAGRLERLTDPDVTAAQVVEEIVGGNV